MLNCAEKETQKNKRGNKKRGRGEIKKTSHPPTRIIPIEHQVLTFLVNKEKSKKCKKFVSTRILKEKASLPPSTPALFLRQSQRLSIQSRLEQTPQVREKREKSSFLDRLKKKTCSTAEWRHFVHFSPSLLGEAEIKITPNFLFATFPVQRIGTGSDHSDKRPLGSRHRKAERILSRKSSIPYDASTAAFSSMTAPLRTPP